METQGFLNTISGEKLLCLTYILSSLFAFKFYIYKEYWPLNFHRISYEIKFYYMVKR